MTTPTSSLDRNLPAFSLQQVKATVAELYCIEGNFRQLNSERDLSYRIGTERGDAYVLKISNAAEPEGVIDLQVKALQHIARYAPELPVPRIIRTKDDKVFDWVADEQGKRHMIRLLIFIEGDVLEYASVHCFAKTRYNLGAFVAHMDLALRNFFHPHANNNVHMWDLSRCLELRPYAHYIEDTEVRQLCEAVLDRAETDTLLRLSRTRHQLIHQDAHCGNVLVNPADSGEIAGIIDFGDMLFGSIVSDLVVAADCYQEQEEDPLQVLCDVAAGFDSVLPLEENEIDLVYDVALIRVVNNLVIINAREAEQAEGEELHLENTGKYDRVLKLLLGFGREKAIRRLREACRFPVYTTQAEGDEVFACDQEELISKRENNLGKIWHFYKKPLNFTRALGAWLYTADGTGYLDAYNNVPQMGHCHPHITKAIARQAKALNTNTRYMCDIVADYAERLTADLPEHLDVCVFVNSGSEANDFAMQLAKYASGHTGALVMEDAYHGFTETSAELSPGIYDQVDHVECLQSPDMYRGPYCNEPEAEAAVKYAADADRAIAALAERGYRPAVFMVDTALCTNGMPAVPGAYFNLVAHKVRQAGGLVIADEVQAGLGRLGTMWGFMAQGLEHVDIVTMGKPVGNGHPLGVVITNKALLDRFNAEVELFSTFGGNTVSCAAGMAVLDVIEREDLINKSNEVGDYFRAQLRRLAKFQSLIGEVRGKGMLIGLEFVTDRIAKTPATEQTIRLLEVMKDNRVLVGSEGVYKNILKLRPSLAWNKREVDIFIDALDRSLSAL